MDLPGSVIEHTSFDSYHHTIYATTSTNMLLGVELLTGKVRSIDFTIFLRTGRIAASSAVLF